jgi:hypothetical protein
VSHVRHTADVLVLGMQLCNEDGSLEADSAHSGAIVQVPQHDFPVLSCTEEVAVVHRPAQRLHLACVATELARHAVGLDIEDDDNAIVLQRSQSQSRCTREKGRIHVQRRAGRRDD